MKKSLIIIGLVVLIAVITNPSQEMHREAVKNKINAFLQKQMKKNSTDTNEVGQALGVMIGGAFAGGLINNLVTSDSYVVFSLTKITWSGQTKVIGVGAFGNVFFFRELDQSNEEGPLEN